MKFKVNIDKLRESGLYIGIPMYGGMCSGITTSSLIELTAMLTAYGIPFQRNFLFNESLIPRARNYIVDGFRRQDKLKTMIFIDADIGFDPKDVFAMMHLQLEHDYDILCAPYPKKVISYEKMKTAVDKGFADEDPQNLENFVGDFVFNLPKGVEKFLIDEPQEVLESGTGFMMFNHNTLEKFLDFFPQYLYTPDHARTEHFNGSRKIGLFFHCEVDPKSDRYLSEDYWFCQKAREAGLKTWLCPWMKLHHAGSYVFKGDLRAIAAVGESISLGKQKKK